MSKQNAMHIELQAAENNYISAYDENKVIINNDSYTTSLIVSKSNLISHWNVTAITQLDIKHCNHFLHAEIVLIGFSGCTLEGQHAVAPFFAHHQIGIEWMNIGAACRTYNVLRSEDRNVVLGLILPF